MQATPRFNNQLPTNKTFITNRRFEDTDFKSFDFEKGLKFINDKVNHFTNFATSEDEETYNLIVDYYIQYVENGDFSFLTEFKIENINPGERIDRLLDIISKVQKTKYKKQDLPFIYKYKSKKYGELRFFIKVSKKNISLLLIDLYHLGIFGRKIQNGKQIIIPIEKNYKKHKHNQCSLSKIKELKDK